MSEGVWRSRDRSQSVAFSFVERERERERGLTPKCSRACSATCGRYPNLGASTSNNRKRWVQERAVDVSQSALQRGFGLFE